MAKEYAQAFYHSKKWKDCRRSYINNRIMIDGGMCEKCHERLGYIVHHKVRITPDNINDPDITLNWDNLRWECKACHDEEEGHGLNKKAALLVAFDEFGQPVPLPPPLNKEVDGF